MNGRLGEEMTQLLTRSGVVDRMLAGERVTVTVSELCGECRHGGGDLEGGPCPMCGGKAWIEREITLRA